MFPEQLKKILNLIEKTGDKVIIYNENEPESCYTLMSLKEYEVLVGEGAEILDKPIIVSNPDLTADDLTDRINCDISTWKNQENSLYLTEESKSRNSWAIPSKIKKGAQKVE